MKKETKANLIGLILCAIVIYFWSFVTAMIIYPICSYKISGIADFVLIISVVTLIIGTIASFFLYAIYKELWKNWIKNDHYQKIKKCFLNSRTK